ncbi:MAG: nucleotide sugar dehydrogenase [Porticoccaceae bacterium]|nr:nucleotide sugar dehydrogenase [Pseudomonadales bacterium]MCP5172697.1 nucleotide sugar dehydrogenase [Pseudomonadales bacterium]MCP5302171.1 nucleotide sugar dehydrogenase [Pseudomonadales bacterium]
MKKTAVVGLGYVGLPLAVAFGKKTPTIGFDLDEKKLSHYRAGRDPSGEVEPGDLKAATGLEFTSEGSRLAEADVIIVAVPTPIDHANRPDLRAILGASRTIAANMSPGTTVIYESTVYPGCTEEDCIPVLEKVSGLPWLGRPENNGETEGFYVGYSPERINPGDKVHRLETITKVVSGDTPATLDKVAATYELVVDAGVYRAASIKVAEAAKVIENTQRDLNIALMNELALIFHRIGIDTVDVLEAAGTKWNFLPFRPGLVGGHCIGVDPYYLTYKAEAEGHHPQVILAGRKTNDGVGKYIAEQTIKQIVKKGHAVKGANIVILGLTFKEDCPDLRNSKVIDIITELKEYQCNLMVHDPLADNEEAVEEYGVELTPWSELKGASAVILAVAHQQYKKLSASDFEAITAPDSTLIDVKSMLDRTQFNNDNINIWRL